MTKHLKFVKQVANLLQKWSFHIELIVVIAIQPDYCCLSLSLLNHLLRPFVLFCSNVKSSSAFSSTSTQHGSNVKFLVEKPRKISKSKPLEPVSLAEQQHYVISWI